MARFVKQLVVYYLCFCVKARPVRSRRSFQAFLSPKARPTTRPTLPFATTSSHLQFTITHVDLDITLDPLLTQVKSKLTIECTKAWNTVAESKDDLYLDGDAARISLVSLELNNHTLSESNDEFEITGTHLIIPHSTLAKMRSTDSTSSFTLHIVVHATPNQELSGLFVRADEQGKPIMCTHCEPIGFSQITYFMDRPDVCAIFRKVRLQAQRHLFPILLSNGNIIEKGAIVDDIPYKHHDQGNDDDNTSHYVVYTDPYPKPCYVFCIVAASKLASVQDAYISKTDGRAIKLELYGPPEDIENKKFCFAIQTLKRVMAWEEDTFGLPYDLDTYRIVATRHFHIGAMENKGLNLFQTSLIATDPRFTTDVTYDVVEKTIAHEYLHNWSGNRVTLLNWQEFTLKEGLTTLRDQFFLGQQRPTATRIAAVQMLREKQFLEDANPITRHPIRPTETVESRVASAVVLPSTSLEALATSTMYHKGAEVFGMYKTIVGTEGFSLGFRLYVDRHDGQGATCDDFHVAMQDANPEYDLNQFFFWFSTPGTPKVRFRYNYSTSERVFSIRLSQRNLASNQLLHIPIAIGLFDKATGQEIVPTTVLHMTKANQVFVFDNVTVDVVPSVLRDFSAPVVLEACDTIKELERQAFLARYDNDGFNKWEAMQKIYSHYVLNLLSGDEDSEIEKLVQLAFRETLHNKVFDASSKAQFLSFPTESELFRQLEPPIDPVKICNARNRALSYLGRSCFDLIYQQYRELSFALETLPTEGITATDSCSRSLRSLRNTLLLYMCYAAKNEEELVSAARLATSHFESAKCFTDQFTAYRLLASMSGNAAEARDRVSIKFNAIGKENESVMNKWFQIQALADLPDALQHVQALSQHPDFKANNAGRFRALITSFTMNTRAFHDASGNGYRYIGSIIQQMDRRSPVLAVELANKLASWQRYDFHRASLMKAELERISSLRPISEKLRATISQALRMPSGALESSSKAKNGAK